MIGSDVVARLLAQRREETFWHSSTKNPEIMDSLEGVALRIGRKAESIEVDINDLVAGRTRNKEGWKPQSFLVEHASGRDLCFDPPRPLRGIEGAKEWYSPNRQFFGLTFRKTV